MSQQPKTESESEHPWYWYAYHGAAIGAWALSAIAATDRHYWGVLLISFVAVLIHGLLI